MKKYVVIAIIACLFVASCAQKEEKREEFKEKHDVSEKMNQGVPTAALSDSAQIKDSITVESK